MPDNLIKITFLVDNNPGEACKAEHGLSIFIEADAKILFDSGQSTLFLENAAQLGIDIASADCMVLSHGHYDHGNGFEHMTGKKLVCHPGCFIKRYRAEKSAYIGLNYHQQFARENFDLILSSQPLRLSKNILFLGEIPRSNSFEAKQTAFVKEDGTSDFVSDDSALILDSQEGLIIIVGCGHSGVCNIIEYARKITGKNQIAAVVGGFHIKEGSPAIQPTIEYLLKADIGLLMPCHCVDESVISLFSSIFCCEPVFAGKTRIF